MQITPYLTFDGNCAEAFRFYATALSGDLVMLQTHGESPAAEHVPPEWHDRIMHARLVIGEAVLMGSDTQPGTHARPTAGFSVSLQLEDPDEAERIFDALAEGGTIQMPIAESFWARRFGMLTDQFGIPWMINCH